VPVLIFNYLRCSDINQLESGRPRLETSCHCNMFVTFKQLPHQLNFFNF